MGNSKNTNYVQILLETLQKQESTLQELLAITKRQSELANAQEFQEDLFGETLNQKEILFAVLNQLDDGFSSVYGRVRSEIMQAKEQYQKEIAMMQDYIKRCTDLGIEIRVLEERNRDRLVQCFTEKNRQYGSQKNAASVVSKYHQTMYSGRMSGSNYTL